MLWKQPFAHFVRLAALSCNLMLRPFDNGPYMTICPSSLELRASRPALAQMPRSMDACRWSILIFRFFSILWCHLVPVKINVEKSAFFVNFSPFKKAFTRSFLARKRDWYWKKRNVWSWTMNRAGIKWHQNFFVA